MTVRREGQQPTTLAEQFRDLCQNRDTLPDVFTFLESASSASPQVKAKVLLIDQAFRIEAGCLRPVEEYFAHFPDVAENEASSLELVAGEFRHRTRRGESISVETFLARFPRLRNHLAFMLGAVPQEEPSHDATVEISMNSLIQGKEATLDVPLDSLNLDQGEKTLEISADSLLTQLNEKDQPRSTVDWEATEDGTNAPPQTVDDTAHENTSETLHIDPQSLGDMLGQYGTIEVSDADQTLGGDPKQRAVTSDTLFEEGAAYDKDRHLEEFGDYELLGEIARGGMGVVFKARQRKLKRIVALKMILSGNLADEEDIRRFYAEAEAAAALDHPNIVPVYEVGEYRGQHYFSMGYVEGQSLADKIAEHPLPAREAAQMMKVVAEAVEYAHQHGVIHRDLKPANVLLDAQDQPKITDFGLAKRTEAEAELTHTGQLMGTPSYMSPEQVSGDSRQVGPPSDVFAMGGMLYCLLTGRPPFQSPTLLDLLKQVKHQEPVSPRRLTPNLPVDLETICLKCLAKEPSRRYGSAKEFAEDLDRFLKGIPVLARPVSQAERVWRWCKRYPVVAGLILAVILSLVSGATVSTYYAIVANRRAKEATEQYERAERNFQKAQAAVNEFFVQVSDNTLLNQPGMQPLQHQLLKQALAYYQAFLAERGDDPDLQDELAVTQFRVGIITEIVESPEAAIPSFEKARELQMDLLKTHPDDLQTLQQLGDTLTALGRVYYRTKGFERAEDIFKKAVEVRGQIAEDQPQNHEAQRELANAYMNLGLVERGRAESQTDPEEHAEALKDAREFYDKSQTIRRAVLKQGGLSTEILRKVYRDLGLGGYNLGTILFQMQKDDLGVASYRESAMDLKKALEIEPKDQRTTLSLAICLHALAKSEPDQTQAWEYGQDALNCLEPLVQANPEVDDYRKELILLQADFGLIPHDKSKDPEAKQLLEKSRIGLEWLLNTDPNNSKLLLKALIVYQRLLQQVSPEESDAMDPLGNGLQQIADRVQEKIINEHRGGKFRGEFAVKLFQLGHQLQRLGNLRLAIQVSRHGVALVEQLAKEAPANLNYHKNLHLGLGQLAQLLTFDGQLEQAQAAHRKRLDALREFAKQIPNTPETELDRANLKYEEAKVYNSMARLSLSQTNPQSASEDLENAKELLDALIKQFPAHQAFFEQELKQTQSLRKQLLSHPAIAEKPASKSTFRTPPKSIR